MVTIGVLVTSGKDSTSGDKRKTYSEAQNIALVVQVGSVCPLCAEPLFNEKGKRRYKAYELAHIYPLNPSAEETEILKDEERFGSNINDEDNVIPLCQSCHGKFDKPRTVEEYRTLLAIKKNLIARSGQESLWKLYHIEEEIGEIVEELYKEIVETQTGELNFDPKAIDNKTNDSISKPTVKKIKNNVTDYFHLIRNKMAYVDKNKTDFSTIVSQQINAYYRKQKQ
jgi:hypothetical protein